MRGPGRGPGGPGMAMPGETAQNFGQTTRRLLRYLKPYHGRLLAVLAAVVGGSVFNLFAPRLVAQAVDTLAGAARQRLPVNFDALGLILLSMVALYALASAFQYVQQRLTVTVAQGTVFRLRQQIDQKLARLPLAYFDKHERGDLLSRATNDVDNIATSLQQSLAQMLSSAVTVLGVLVMMLTLSPLMTLVAVATLPLLMLVTMGVAKRSQSYFAQQWQRTGALNAHIEEMFTGHQVVRLYGYEAASVARFDETNQQLYDVSWKAQFISGVIMPMMNAIGNLAFTALCVLGGALVIGGGISVGQITAFTTYMRQFTQPIGQLANMMNMLQSAVASAERVFELLDEAEEEPDAPDAARLADPKGSVVFEDVTFGYDPAEPLMQHLNIRAEAGQTVAIVGPTGAGKTTLVNLLMRFYELQGGRILLDGVDIRTLTRENLRATFGMVLQDAWLFHGTIRENVAYAKPDATDEQVRTAAKAAYVHHFVRTLPDGYGTMLGEEASNLSQGQRQLLTIARTVLADPAVLILDEATSSVDTRTEVLIQKAMRALMQNRTSFVIAHRLSTIRNADLILVMDHGSIVEQGTHAQLLEKGGFYATLYNSQWTAGNG
jgi:ATP-binding cassette subfamily B protein